MNTKIKTMKKAKGCTSALTNLKFPFFSFMLSFLFLLLLPLFLFLFFFFFSTYTFYPYNRLPYLCSLSVSLTCPAISFSSSSSYLSRHSQTPRQRERTARVSSRATTTFHLSHPSAGSVRWATWMRRPVSEGHVGWMSMWMKEGKVSKRWTGRWMEGMMGEYVGVEIISE